MLEVSDNWLSGQYMNVPLADLKAIVDNAIDKGYTIAWGSDVSEKGFTRDGLAVLLEEEKATTGSDQEKWVGKETEKQTEKAGKKGKKEVVKPELPKEMTITQEMRQDMFDRQETTDDHGMVIVGKATDQNGNEYYKVQNSWTDKQKYGGYFYVSMPYFLAKTMDIYVNKEAVPAAIRKRTGI